MKCRNFTNIIIIGVLVILASSCIVVYKIDPYQQYHKPQEGLTYVMATNDFSYYNPGIAKNYDYDTVITGSSMSRSFQPGYVEEKLGYKTIKLSMAEARGKDFADLFDVLERQDNWKRTIMGLDTFAFKVDKDYSSYEKPLYLYDEKLYNDIYYAINMDGVLGCAKVIADTKTGEQTTTMDDYQNYALTNTFSREQVLNLYDKTVEKNADYDQQKLELTIKENLMKNIIPVIERNEDREFIFYFPPYSIVRWANTVNVMEDIEAMKIICEQLIGYPNVSIFFYQGEQDVITDLDHYMDTIHYDSIVANQIIDYISDGNNRMTENNFEKILDEFKKFVLEYDYSMLRDEK